MSSLTLLQAALSLLVHVLYELCESGGDDCSRVHRYVLGDTDIRRSAVHHCAVFRWADGAVPGEGSRW